MASIVLTQNALAAQSEFDLQIRHLFTRTEAGDTNNDGVVSGADLVAVVRRTTRRTPTASLTSTPTATRTPTTTTPTLDPTPLRVLAETHGKTIGVAAQSWLLETPEYANILATQFGTLTPEYEMNPNIWHPAQNVYDMSGLDRLAEFALEHKMKLFGHPLLWREQLPPWVLELPPAERAQVLKDQAQYLVRYFSTKYPDLVTRWTLINEPIDDSASAALRTFWQELGGIDFFVEVINIVRAEDPHADLMCNEYGAEALGRKSDAILGLMKQLRGLGAPLDSVGLEMHWRLNDRRFIPALKENIQRIGDEGFGVHLTEIDIRLPLATASDLLDDQATLYGDITRTCLNQRYCRSMTFWGIDDGHTWIDSFFEGFGWPLLYTAEYAPKQAYMAVREALLSPGGVQ